MSIESYLSYFLVGAMFLTQAIMLWLQLAASMRHRQRSFVLLSVATICGILFLLVSIVPIKMNIEADMHTPLFYLSSSLLAMQMILGVWGTAELFRAYRKLASQLPV